MLNHLDKKFRITSKIGLATARNEYQQLRFRPGNDMSKFIELFDQKANTFEEAGGMISDEDKVIQLSLALPAEYDLVTDWYDNLPEEKQIYESFTKKLVEKFDRLKLRNNDYVLKQHGNHSRNERENQDFKIQKNYRNSYSSFNEYRKKYDPKKETRKCFMCHEIGHIATFCPIKEY